MPTGQMLSRMCGRAFTLYAVPIRITMLAIAMLAASAIIYDNPLILEWHNATAVFMTRFRQTSALWSSCTNWAFSTFCCDGPATPIRLI